MKKTKRLVVDLKSIWSPHREDRAQRHLLQIYRRRARNFLNNKSVETIVLTGSAPVWLYLAIFDELQNSCDSIVYNSPLSGEITIFKPTEKGLPQLVNK